MTDQMKDGVYFNLNEDEYHSLKRLSASGINNMLVSPATFWHNSWLNPDRKDDDTPARILGRAYHTARLEPHRFYDLFCSELDKDDYADALLTDTDIKAALKDMEQPQTKAGETVVDRAHRLRSLGYDGQIWHLELEEWGKQIGNRTPIAAKYWREIEADMQRFRSSPEVANLLSDGAAEVSILWTCPDTGIAMKSRIDYLKSNMVVDLKTFQNSSRKFLDDAIADAFRYNRYYIQAALYWSAVELIRSGDLVAIDAREDQATLFDAVASSQSPLESWYVFQEKGGIPNLLAYKIQLLNPYPSIIQLAAACSGPKIADEDVFESVRDSRINKSSILLKAEAEISHAKHEFLTYSEVYGNGEPWQPTRPLRQIDDEMYSRFWFEQGVGGSASQLPPPRPQEPYYLEA